MLLRDNLNYIEIEKIDISHIATRIVQLEDSLWEINKSRQSGNSPHYDTKSIIINDCLVPPTTYPVYQFPTKSFFIDEELNRYTKEITDYLEKQYDGIAGKVIYAKLFAGKYIPEHVDPGYLLQIVHRFHIPIITNAKAEFIVGGQMFHMKAGFLYELNNQVMHGVRNLGDEDRIHLIVDIIPNNKIASVV